MAWSITGHAKLRGDYIWFRGITINKSDISLVIKRPPILCIQGKEIKLLELPQAIGQPTGVYFLFLETLKDGDVLFYIGRSRNVISRVGEHIGLIPFTHAYFVPCRHTKLSVLETFLIERFAPKYNGSRKFTQRENTARKKVIDYPEEEGKVFREPTGAWIR